MRASEWLLNAADVRAALTTNAPLPPFRLRNGLTIYHGPGDPAWAVFREIFLKDCYVVPEFYSPSPGDTVVDCGANIGCFALYMSSLAPGIRLFCFEPGAKTFERLQFNIAANRLQNQVAAFRAAIWDREAIQELRLVSVSGDASIFTRPDHPTLSTQLVPCISLPKAFSKYGVEEVDLLKIDVEGSELEILRGASDLDWGRVRRVVMECHDFIRPGVGCQVVALLAKYGFKPIDVQGSLHTQCVIRAQRH
jgi:FkbM family methyltransferase